MSSSMYWEPPRPASISSAMKFLLQERYGSPVDEVLAHGRDYNWLEGIRAVAEGDVLKDAQKLCDLIDKYERVRIWEGE